MVFKNYLYKWKTRVHGLKMEWQVVFGLSNQNSHHDLWRLPTVEGIKARNKQNLDACTLKWLFMWICKHMGDNSSGGA